VNSDEIIVMTREMKMKRRNNRRKSAKRRTNNAEMSYISSISKAKSRGGNVENVEENINIRRRKYKQWRKNK